MRDEQLLRDALRRATREDVTEPRPHGPRRPTGTTTAVVAAIVMVVLAVGVALFPRLAADRDAADHPGPSVRRDAVGPQEAAALLEEAARSRFDDVLGATSSTSVEYVDLAGNKVRPRQAAERAEEVRVRLLAPSRRLQLDLRVSAEPDADYERRNCAAALGEQIKQRCDVTVEPDGTVVVEQLTTIEVVQASDGSYLDYLAGGLTPPGGRTMQEHSIKAVFIGGQTRTASDAVLPEDSVLLDEAPAELRALALDRDVVLRHSSPGPIGRP